VSAPGLAARSALLFASALSVFGVSCSPPSSDERSMFAAPPRSGFEPVSELLHARCGSLDCHGQLGRNLRLYGTNGLRLDARDVPGQDGGVTSGLEHDANYSSIVALEPEVLDRVVRETGRDPARLTLVRKARNAEDHVGAQAIAPGSDADRCLLSWLALGIDETACERGTMLARPPTR
jgi:hypothetical protein